jgi:hypothetical protein
MNNSSEPSARQEYSSNKLVVTKFSDIISYLQLLQTRISLTLALIALIVTASVTAMSAFPFTIPPPGSFPLTIYLSVIAITISTLFALGVMTMPVNLQNMIFERLSSRQLPYSDFTPIELQEKFLQELRRKQKGLTYSNRCMIFGVVVMFIHLFSSYISYNSYDIGRKIIMGPYVSKYQFAEYLVYYFKYTASALGVQNYSLFYTLCNILLTITILQIVWSEWNESVKERY